MKPVPHVATFFLVLAVCMGCASAKSQRREVVTEKIPRPEHIWVHDFAATASEVPAGSRLSGAPPASGQTAEQIEAGRKAGRILATHLVEELRKMGYPAEQASAGTRPRINDLVIRGYLVSYTSGNEAERLVVGMGKGASELKAAVEGFQVTERGLRLLGEGTVQAGGSKSPGMAMSAASIAATGNPAGLIVSSAVKAEGEATGSSKLEGRARAAAEEIAKQLEPRLEQQHWGY